MLENGPFRIISLLFHSVTILDSNVVWCNVGITWRVTQTGPLLNYHVNGPDRHMTMDHVTLTLFWIRMHKRVAFDFFHESKFPIYRWFRDKIGYSSLFKDIPPIIPAYQYSDMMILMELFQDLEPITRSFMRCTLKLIVKRLFEVSGLLSDNYKNDVFNKKWISLRK